ncbi:hypothetical protein F2P81_023092 [Scophthalmus maximus]|uniref:SRCR domain-containing protein n=1 Tax=Scophthalmus maximus TaxID=52904 RepID=A0A6A4RY81_SCOMX|nr:hypothetical protein F2P81_023092 [Scophthalmus maximus]
MKPVKYILIAQLCCLCQAFQNSSTPTDPTDVQVQAEGNGTEGILPEEFSSDPYVHLHAGGCKWTLRLPGNRSSDEVPLSSDSADPLAQRICQGLGCGGVYHVDKTGPAAPNATCFHDCSYKDHRLQNCSRTAGSDCTVITEAVCGHQALRLVGGPDRCAGRVELWRNGMWGTVCDDRWDLRDAGVACAQLGCGYALSVTGQGDGSFAPGRGPVHLDELNCTGQEGNLWACPAAQEEPDCGHKEDAGVICSEMRAIRLTGGLDRCSGKLEVHRNGSWGTVCDNCWNEGLASVVCSMLRCGATPLKVSQFVPALAHNGGTLWYYQCGPAERSLWQCREFANRTHLCAHSKASGVICGGTTTAAAAAAGVFISASPELLSAVTVCLLLLLLLIINTVLCCHYRRRHAFLFQQTRSGPRPRSGHSDNDYQGAVDLVKVTAAVQPQTDDSQRYRTDTNPLTRPSALDSLCEEVPEPSNRETGAFPDHSRGPHDAQCARVSKISVDSFETTSTSSGECYENINNSGHIMVTPDPEQGQSSAANGALAPLRLLDNNNQLYYRQTTDLSSSECRSNRCQHERNAAAAGSPARNVPRADNLTGARRAKEPEQTAFIR